MKRSEFIVPLLKQMWVRMVITATLFGALYGGILAFLVLLDILTSIFASTPYMRASYSIALPMLVIIIGGGLGTFIGIFIGAVVSPICTFITLWRYFPLPHYNEYKSTIRAVNTLVTMICMMVFVYILFPVTSMTDIGTFLMVLVTQVVLSGIGAWWTTGHFADRYEFMLYMSPKRKNDEKSKRNVWGSV